MTPDFLAIGHVTVDLEGGVPRLGGTAAFAALTAAHLGLKSAVLTATALESLPELSEAGVLVERVSSTTTTTFENHYSAIGRVQFIRSVAGPLTESAVPTDWLRTPIVLLGPVAREVSPALALSFPTALMGITPQGWLRRWDAAGRVRRAEWESAAQVLARANVAVVSLEDLPDSKLLEEWSALVPLLVVTSGHKAGRFFWQGRWHSFPVYPRIARDPTGAGDVFAAALLVRLHQTGDPVKAVVFASYAASFCVESPGLKGVPHLATVLTRVREAESEIGE